MNILTRRVIGFLIDYIIFIIGKFSIVITIWSLYGISTMDNGSLSIYLSLLISLIIIALSAFNCLMADGLKNYRSIGKRIMKIQVVKKDLNEFKIYQSVTRNALKYIMITFIPFIYLIHFFTKKDMLIHDYIFNTYVA